MKYIVESDKTVEQAAIDLEASAKKYKFGVLHIHDLQATLKSKGIEFSNSCRILEVCNPEKAHTVLAKDMSLNMALPCRVSVWEEVGKTKIGMIRPKAMLEMLLTPGQLENVAQEVEDTLIQIINEAK